MGACLSKGPDGAAAAAAAAADQPSYAQQKKPESLPVRTERAGVFPGVCDGLGDVVDARLHTDSHSPSWHRACCIAQGCSCC
jgi:hypothetical protein